MSSLSQYPFIKTVQDISRKKKCKVYLVGGFLRDRLLDKPNYDLDFAVTKDGLKFARAFADQVKGSYVLLDRERGCARIVKKINGGIFTFDFADFRAKTFRGDLAHRDFTINTLAVDLSTCSLTDPLAKLIEDPLKGKRDLKAKMIRMVAPKAFVEDPLRMLRAFSLKAALNFKIAPETLRRIKKDAHRLRDVSPERIREELFKVLKTDRAAENLKAMDRTGLLEKVIPQVRVMYGCRQGGYHHLDVWPHSLEVVVQVEKIFKGLKDQEVLEYLHQSLAGDRTRKDLVKLACLLHDIGKPDTRKVEGERMSFHGHEHVGKHIVRHIAKALKLSTKERHALEDMVRWHLRPGYLSDLKHLTQKAVYRYFRDTKEEAASILLLSLADQRSTRGPLTSEHDQQIHEEVCLKLVRQWFDQRKEKSFVPLLTGHDLIKKLKMKPSPLFGKILEKVKEQQMLGKVTTKKEALATAKKLKDRQ